MPDKNPIERVQTLSSTLDVKQIPKRTFQLGLIAVIVASLIGVYNVSVGLYLSGIFIFFFCIAIAITLVLTKKKLIKYPQASIAVSVCILLILDSFATGLRVAGYLYFFPLLFALTAMVDHERSYRELTMYYIICSVSFLICVVFADYDSTWQTLSTDNYRSLLFSNCFFSFALSICFCYVSILFEQRYARALMQQKNKAEDAMHIRTRFLSNMGHELRTPLNGIIGTINLLGKQKVLPDQEEYFNILKYCSDHMLQQVNDILDFNKIEAGKLELYPVNFNLRQLLLNSTLPFYNRFEEKMLELRVEVDEQLNQTVFADDIRLIQVLNNLLSNALKFTEEGYVRLRASEAFTTEKSCAVNFEISDTGIGIDPENQKKIFEGYSQILSDNTRKYGGTGLGLSITRKLLELMNSTLQLNSIKSEGSTFTFQIVFDRVNQQQLDSNQPEAATVNDLSGMNILIAEDNKINMMIARKLIEGWNASLTLCYNGVEALQALEEHSDYHVILLDLEMPEMDGYTAIVEMKRLYPNIPVLAFTASLIDNKMYHSLLEIGFADCVLKPFQPLNLLHKLKQHVLPV